jgi:PleD family two-component response regulator
MKILVVDDDPLSRRLTGTAVTRLGHEAAATEDGAAAWRRFNQDKPDVLITDLVMPGVDGLELCRRVRADAGAGYTYIILATVLGAAQNVVRGMEAGGEEFLLVLPEQTLDSARVAVERVRRAVEQLAIGHAAAGPVPLTISAGIAAFGPGQATTVEQLLEQADAALYRAKSAGRNRIAVGDR